MSTPAIQSLVNEALGLHQQGRFGDALKVCERIVSEGPGFAYGHALHGATLAQLGKLIEAAEAMGKFAGLVPGDVGAQVAYAQALLAGGKKVEAIEKLRGILKVNPGMLQGWLLLGQACVELGDFGGTVGAWGKALEILPANFPAERRAALIANLGAAYSDAGDYAKAMPLLKQGMALSPGHQGRVLNYSKALLAEAEFDEAEVLLKNALGMGKSARAYQDLASAVGEQGFIEEAIGYQRKAMELDWNDVRHHSNLLLSMRYSDVLTPEEVTAEHRKFGMRFPVRAVSFANVKDSERRIRVGYLSPDFCRHPVASFIEAVLRNHDRSGFEVIGFHTGQRTDEVTAKLKGLADGWEVIGKTVNDKAAAEMIRERGIDVLIDLSGHTSHNRLPILAERAAPVQGSYLGYPGTTGLSQVDFFMSDSVVDPAGNDSHYVERLVRLDDGKEDRLFLAFTPDVGAAEVSGLPALKVGEVTFGALGNLAKVSETTIRAWGKILQAVPGSRLVIRGRAAGSKGARERILGKIGVEASRVEFLGWAPGGSRWDLYSRIDVGLDSFPYHGTTTTCESLWMGLPTLAMVGKAHAARVGLTIAKAIGLPELVARSEEEMVLRAVELVGDLPRLAEIRRGMRERMKASPLMDGAGLTRAIERVYREQWGRWCGVSVMG